MSDENPSPLRHDWPRWAPAAQAIALFLFHGALPFGLSRLSYRHGWPAGHPSAWNLLGLLPVAAGIALIVWTIALHRRDAVRQGWRFEKTPFEPPPYLIVDGPYRYSRNPIYLSHLTIWIGWALFYGSVAVLLGIVAIWLPLKFVILPYEERGLRRAMGEAYGQSRAASRAGSGGLPADGHLTALQPMVMRRTTARRRRSLSRSRGEAFVLLFVSRQALGIQPHEVSASRNLLVLFVHDATGLMVLHPSGRKDLSGRRQRSTQTVYLPHPGGTGRQPISRVAGAAVPADRREVASLQAVVVFKSRVLQEPVGPPGAVDARATATSVGCCA